MVKAKLTEQQTRKLLIAKAIEVIGSADESDISQFILAVKFRLTALNAAHQKPSDKIITNERKIIV